MNHIRLRPLVALAALLAASLLPKTALAAPGPTLPILGSPNSIALGGYLPSGGDAKDQGGDAQYAVEFRYTLPIPEALITPTRTVISLGVQTSARSGSHSTVVPLTVAELIGANGQSPNAAGNAYFGAGAGVYFINQSGLSTATRIGGFGEVGYNVTSAVFLDAKYQFVSHADGLQLTAGLRF